MVPIIFLPFQKTILADGQRTLLEMARKLGLPLQGPCGAKKICGRCRIIIEESRIFGAAHGKGQEGLGKIG